MNPAEAVVVMPGTAFCRCGAEHRGQLMWQMNAGGMGWSPRLIDVESDVDINGKPVRSFSRYPLDQRGRITVCPKCRVTP